MKILYDGEYELEREILSKMEEGGAFCVEEEGLPSDRAEVSLTLVDEAEIQELNRTYRGVDRVTDVLSFPQYDDLSEIPQTGELLLGDVVICREQALRQAEEFGHSQERELVYLFIHSVCHLLGYDHMEEEDKAEMRAREEEVMSKLCLER